jgi:hypothetical protein
MLMGIVVLAEGLDMFSEKDISHCIKMCSNLIIYRLMMTNVLVKICSKQQKQTFHNSVKVCEK